MKEQIANPRQFGMTAIALGGAIFQVQCDTEREMWEVYCEYRDNPLMHAAICYRFREPIYGWLRGVGSFIGDIK